MAFELIGDGGDSARFISKSNYFRSKVESREYDTLLSFYCFFSFHLFCVCYYECWSHHSTMSVGHIILGGLLGDLILNSGGVDRLD